MRQAAANIPRESTFFAWAYPAVLDPSHGLPAAASPEKAFLEYGGYIYFNDRRDAVGTNSITPAPLGTLGLMFGRPQLLSQAPAETIERQGRFQEITLAPLATKGATHFAWIRPHEFQDTIACPDGGFAYKFRDGSPRYYPVVQQPVYTPELLAEDLDERESWVVVRFVDGPPTIEQLVVFDRSQPLEANLANTADQSGVVLNLNNTGLDVTLRHELACGREVSYEEWAARGSPEVQHQGTLEDPWIAVVRLASTEELSLY
mmetsp:Transcript_12676/g.26315  ORF Transcript_12676/g.26315 Transcript_12676/m.26315 type:complete len:261 (+) Transcript_12676:194-976(+)